MTDPLTLAHRCGLAVLRSVVVLWIASWDVGQRVLVAVWRQRLARYLYSLVQPAVDFVLEVYGRLDIQAVTISAAFHGLVELVMMVLSKQCTTLGRVAKTVRQPFERYIIGVRRFLDGLDREYGVTGTSNRRVEGDRLMAKQTLQREELTSGQTESKEQSVNGSRDHSGNDEHEDESEVELAENESEGETVESTEDDLEGDLDDDLDDTHDDQEDFHES